MRLFFFILLLFQPCSGHSTSTSQAPAGVYADAPLYPQKSAQRIERPSRKWGNFWAGALWVSLFMAQFVVTALLVRMLQLVFPVMPIWLTVVLGIALLWGIVLLAVYMASYIKKRKKRLR